MFHIQNVPNLKLLLMKGLMFCFLCFFQNVYAPDEDPEMEIINYDRTFEQNEELGLNDMKTENYEES